MGFWGAEINWTGLKENSPINQWKEANYSVLDYGYHVHGVSDDDFWVISQTYNAGQTRVDHIVGGLNVSQNVLSTSAGGSPAMGLYFANSNEGWALAGTSAGIRVYHYLNGTWSTQHTFSGYDPTLISLTLDRGNLLTGTSSSNVFAGVSDQVFKYNGSTWALSKDFLTLRRVTGMHAKGSNVWVTSVDTSDLNGTLHKFNGTTWSDPATQADATFFDVFEDTTTKIVVTGNTATSGTTGGKHWIYNGTSLSVNYVTTVGDTTLCGTRRIYGSSTMGDLRMTVFDAFGDAYGHNIATIIYVSNGLFTYSYRTGSWVKETTIRSYPPNSVGDKSKLAGFWGIDGGGTGCV